MKTKKCADCKRRLTISKFFVYNGKAKNACKDCYWKGRSKLIFTFKDRFGHLAGPSAEDAEKCRLAHDKLMAEIRGPKK